MKKKKNKLQFSIFKLKIHDKEIDEYIENPEDLTSYTLINDLVGKIYVGHNKNRDPSWLKYVNTISSEEINVKNKSSRVVIILLTRGSYFALCFGYGKHLIKDEYIIRDFGLKIVLNSVDPNKLRSIDLINFREVPFFTRKQPGKNITINDFELDYLNDLLKTLTGFSKDETFASLITGRDSVLLYKEIDDLDLSVLCNELDAIYKKTDYKDNFAWVDNITNIRDSLKIDKLEKNLIAEIRNRRFDDIFLSPPEVIDFKTVGFKFTYYNEIVSSLESSYYFESIPDLSIMNIEKLKNNKVYAINLEAENVIDSWSIYNSIYFETKLNGKPYFLFQGDWYVASKSFIEKINAELDKIKYSRINIPDYIDGENEGVYNKRVINLNNSLICLDRDNITVGGSPIESCDLYSNKKQFIHVKRWSSSATFSHLLSQARISAILFLQDPMYRKELIKKVTKINKLYAKYIDEATPTAKDYEIIYAIIHKTNSDLKKTLPLFSKINLVNSIKQLRGMGYKTSVKHIKIK
jgi:uncharacterized protein (TIGR04141 family)